MKPSSSQSSEKRNVHEWVSAIGTLLVLSGIYASMDNFSSYDTPPENTISQKSNTTMSVAPPYWNSDLGYGFRSIAGDRYDATGSYISDVVSVRNNNPKVSAGEVTVSYYKNTSREVIDKSLEPDTPRTYTNLPHGIAVIQGDLDSVRAKTIFSTLHSQ